MVGTTGVGKSSGVAILLTQILEERPDLRVFLIDPHNEYGRCFGDKAQVLTPRNLRLPFWLFNFEETVDAFFGGRPGIDDEVEILSEAIPEAKAAYVQLKGSNDRALTKKKDPKTTGLRVDTPVPYRIEDLITVIDDRMGKLENRSSHDDLQQAAHAHQDIPQHPRYGFMFENATVGGDTMAEVVSHLFRIPANGKPMTIMQLAGFPAEVVDSVVSVLSRMAFDFGLWSDGASPLLFVCEEAHRYAPADRNDRLRPDPARAVAHRQGRPQVRRVPRPRDAAPGRDRPQHHLPVQHHVRDAAVERPRPGADPLGDLRRRREHADLRSVARHRRGVRVRRRRAAADADEIPRSAGGAAADQRGRRQHPRSRPAPRPTAT